MNGSGLNAVQNLRTPEIKRETKSLSEAKDSKKKPDFDKFRPSFNDLLMKVKGA